jgi:hypothetical protein
MRVAIGEGLIALMRMFFEATSSAAIGEAGSNAGSIRVDHPIKTLLNHLTILSTVFLWWR